MNEPTKQREGDQRLPDGGHLCVQDRVIADMEESKRVGVERYGSVLKTFNGRSTIQDVHEEVRDLHVYLTQVRMEAEADRETLVKVVTEALQPEFIRSHFYQDPEEQSRAAAQPIAEIAVDRIMGWVAGQWEQGQT